MIKKAVEMFGNALIFVAAWYFMSVFMILATTGTLHWDFWGIFECFRQF